MKMKKWLAPVLGIVLFTAPFYGVNLKPGAQNIYTGTGAKETSLAYTGIASVDSMSGMWFNPASLGSLKRLANSLTIGGFGTQQFLADLGFAFPTLAGVFWFDALYQFGPDNGVKNIAALNIAISKPITDTLYWGFGLKSGYANLLTPQSSDWMLGFDMGIVSFDDSTNSGFGFLNFGWGVVLKNVGKTIGLTNSDPMPGMGIGLGGSFYLLKYDAYKMKIAADILVPWTPFDFTAGISIEQSLFDLFYLRAGYNYNNFGIGPFTFGVGLSGKFGLAQNSDATTDIDLSYAVQMQKYNGLDEFGHFVTLSIAWGYYDNIAPSVGVKQEHMSISPNNDGVQDVTKLDLNALDNTLLWGWKLEIFDSQNKKIKVFEGLPESKIQDLTLEKFFTQIFSAKKAVDVPAYLSWEGVNDLGIQASDGKYSFQLIAWDENKNTATNQKGFIVIDTEVPKAEVTAQYMVFSPNGDGAKEDIAFSLKGQDIRPDDKIAAEIWNAYGIEVKSYSFTSSVPDKIVWDGKDAGGNPAPEGDYTLIVSAYDAAGNRSVAKVDQFKLVKAVQSAVIAMNREGFSPNGDGWMDDVTVKPSISDLKGMEKWELRILSADGKTVTKYDGAGEIPQELSWDGKDVSGKQLPNGVYSFEFQVFFDSGNHPSSEKKTVKLDTQPPLLKIEIPKPLIQPNDTGKIEAVEILLKDLTGDQTDIFRVKIVDSQETLVKYDKFTKEMYDNGDPADPGNPDKYKKYLWDGRGNDVKPVPDGKYTFIIETYDELGNSAQITAPKQIIVKAGFESVTAQADTAAISPQGEGNRQTANFKFTISDTKWLSQFTFIIKDDTGKTVKKVAGPSFIPAYEWDGKDDGGKYVKEGVYTYFAIAEFAEIEQKTNSIERKIVVDNEPPKIELKPAKDYTYLAFSPNNDGVKESIVFDLNLDGNEGDRVFAYIKDANGNIVRKYIWKNINDVPDELKWDGNDDKGNPLPQGKYTLVINGVDIAGNSTEMQIENIKLVREFEKLEFVIKDYYLAPNGKSDYQKLTFASKLSSADGLIEAKMTIFDELGRAVKSYKMSDFINDKNNYTEAVWKGESDYGNGVAPDGVYSAQVVYIYDSGNQITGKIPNIILDRTTPELNLWSVPNYFSPDGDGKNDTLFLNVNVLDKNGIENWELNIYKVLTIYKKEGVFTDYIPFKKFSGKGSTNSATLAWDGKSDRPGEAVGSMQDYLVVLSSSDKLGNKAALTNRFESGILIKPTSDGFMIIMDSISFGYDSAALNPNDKKKLAQLADMFKKLIQNPTNYGITNAFLIEIRGHTDERGPENYNAKLSLDRANSVFAYLTVDLNVFKSLLYPKGAGETELLVKNIADSLSETEKERLHAQNRRVEFYIHIITKKK
ncbi:MAG: hypothetical protein A2Y33_15585 [Spirochaetes bacterium GWF1_51_8]|nr:MAG: hypothetical protein A2Y33_15585 [Spirochaetes bacterium GWF1_51_8]